MNKDKFNYRTSDGSVFYNEKLALLHAKSLKNKSINSISIIEYQDKLEKLVLEEVEDYVEQVLPKKVNK